MIDPTRGYARWVLEQLGEPTAAGLYALHIEAGWPAPRMVQIDAWREWLDHCKAAA